MIDDVSQSAPASPGTWAAPAAASTPAGRAFSAALFAVGFMLVFRGWLFSGFDRAFGDDEDGYLALAIIEHWRHVFSGAVAWTDPLFFHPVRGTLGYSDGFFLFGLTVAPLRAGGVDTFTAFMVAMAGLAAAGFFGFRHLAMRYFGVSEAFAAVGAYLFAFANVDAVKLIHAQAYCAMLLPALCVLALLGLDAKRASPRWAIMAAVSAGLLYAALFLTAFQTAWFFGLYLLLMGLLFVPACGVAAMRNAAAALMASRRSLRAAALALAIGIVPFLVLYVPVLLGGHSRSFAEVASNMPDWRDLANLTPYNAIWGGVLERLGIAGRPDRPMWEVELAFTPAVLALFAIGLIWLAPGLRRRPVPDRILFVGGLAVIFLWLLQMDFFGVRPWEAVWALVPGATAVRYPYRSQLVANLFVALVVARLLAQVGRARLVTVLLCAFLIVEQANLVWPATTSRRDALAWIEAAPAPPAGCLAFYVVPNASPPRRSAIQHQDDAMLFAEIRGIATVNGYSSWFPDGWALGDPASPGYPGAVRDWARRNGIADRVCGLDPRAGRWAPGLPG